MVLRTIRIAAALIDDDRGRLLLVRKAGTRWFMQPGGKIEPGEDALAALRRELREEIGLDPPNGAARYMGRFSAPAANEPDAMVDADIFHIRMSDTAVAGAEIEELLWLGPTRAGNVALAPLTRDCILPLARGL